MCDTRKLLYIQHVTSGVRDRLPEQGFRIRTEGFLYLFLAGIRVDKGTLDTQLLQGYTKQVICSSVYLITGDEMIAGTADIEDRIEVGCLSGRGEHSAHTALESSYLLSHRIIGGICQSGIEIPLFLQVEQHRHLIAVIIFEGRTLYNR